MYHRTVHIPWPCGFPQPVHQGNISRSGSTHTPVYVTNCAELLPVLPQEQFCPPSFRSVSNSNIYTPVGCRILSNKSHPPVKQVAYITNHKIMPQHENSKVVEVIKKTKEETNNNDDLKTANSNKEPKPSESLIVQSSDSESQDSLINRGQKRHHSEQPIKSKQINPLLSDGEASQPKKRLLLKTPEKEPNVKDSLSPTPELVDSTSSEFMSEVIWNLYLQKRQSEETFTKKINLRDGLFTFLKCLMPTCGLYIVGSSLTSLGMDNSDLDMCIMLYPHEINQEVIAINILKTVLRQSQHRSFIGEPELIYAKVPILKFRDRVSDINVDLNVNNSVGIRNTQLLNCYSRLDRRLAPLAIVIKLWAQRHNINDARNMTLSSYSLVLMLIHYFQCGCNPPVFTCLQKEMPDKFNPIADVRHLVLRETIPKFESRNKQNLGQLLLGFFNYFGNLFDFDRNVMSIREGGIIQKDSAMKCPSPKNNRNQWRYICIEEPFERTNTARSVYDHENYRRIISTFQNSYITLMKTKDLQSIFDSLET